MRTERSKLLPRQWLVARTRTPQHEHASDVLHGDGAGPIADLFRQRLAILTSSAGQLHLDQAVRRQRTIHFGEHRLGQTGLTDEDDRLERVCAALQV